MIRIAVVDDNKIVRRIIIDKLALSKDFEIIGEYSSGKEIYHALLKGLSPDVIIMDIEMPEMNGIEATEKITAKFSKPKILMCTVFNDDTNLFKAICAGAKGYLLKDEKPEKIHRAIFEIVEGGSAMSPSIALKALNLIKNPIAEKNSEIQAENQLTKREVEIIELISQGMSYEEVASNTGISYGTVRKHLENIYKKLNVHSKLEAVNKAKKSGFF
ncbi:MAG: response regulator transcription factor [Bacteroidetes bacterium]|nr:response regulator transcription factor [Bacteroidota bacterium]